MFIPQEGPVPNASIDEDNDFSDLPDLPTKDDDQFLDNYASGSTSSNANKARLEASLQSLTGDSTEADINRQIADIDKQLASEGNPTARIQLESERDNLNGELKRAQALSNKASNAGVQTTKSDAKQALLEYKKQKALQDQVNANKNAFDKGLNAVNDKVVSPITNGVSSGVRSIGGLPTYGSIGLLLCLLIFLLFIVVNADGKGTTRIRQLFYMLIGRAHITNRTAVTKGSQGGALYPTPTPLAVSGANVPIVSGVNQGKDINAIATDLSKSNLNLVQQLQPSMALGVVDTDILSGDALSQIDSDFQAFVNLTQAVTGPASFKTDIHTLGDNISFHGTYGVL